MYYSFQSMNALDPDFLLLLLVGKRLLLLSSLSAGNDLRAICYANQLSGRPPGISFPSAGSAFDSSIYLRLVISPVQKTKVSSFENRSFSRMIVFPSSSSSDLSISFTDCQCAM